MTVCGYRCIIILYSYVQLYFCSLLMSVLCPLMCVAYPDFPVIYRSCPGYISIRGYTTILRYACITPYLPF
nr:MAG TPA: hypothetical protein [Caudoviricetes sp.]